MSSRQFRVLKEFVRADTPTAIMSFKSAMKQNAYLIAPNGQQTKTQMPATEVMHSLGDGKAILVISGTFKLLQLIDGTFPDEEVVNVRIPVETRWGGDSVFRRLSALILPSGQEQERPFIVVRLSAQERLVDSLFIGPIAEDQIDATCTFLRFLVAATQKEFSQTELFEMLQSGRLLDTRFAIEELRMHEELSAKHYLLAVRHLPEDHSAEIAYDLFMESRRTKMVKRTMLEALRFFLDGSSPDKENRVLNALRVAIERMSWIEDNRPIVSDVLLLMKNYQARNNGHALTAVSHAEAERVIKLLQVEIDSKHE